MIVSSYHEYREAVSVLIHSIYIQTDWKAKRELQNQFQIELLFEENVSYTMIQWNILFSYLYRPVLQNFLQLSRLKG